MKVLAILDREFAERGGRIDADAFWLVDSPANRALAERLWATGQFDPGSAVFSGSEKVDQAAIERLFHDVDLHHPGWTEIKFIGVQEGASGWLELVAPEGSVTSGPGVTRLARLA